MKSFKPFIVAILAVGLLAACSNNRRDMDTSSSYESGTSSSSQYQPHTNPEPMVTRSQSK